MDVREEVPSSYTESVTEEPKPGAEPEKAGQETESEAAASEDVAVEPAEDASEDEQVTDDQSDGDDEPKDPPKKRRNRTRAERENRRLQQELAELREQVSKLSQPAESEAPAPRQQDYGSPEEYQAAIVNWQIAQRVRAELATERETYQRQVSEAERRSVVTGYQERVEDARDKYEDFDEVAGDRTLPITDAMADAIMSSEVGPDIQYHLGSNPDLAAKISRMTPVLQAKEIGLLEARLSAPPSKRLTNAPPPPKTLQGKSTPQKDPGNMSQKEYEAWRRKGSG